MHFSAQQIQQQAQQAQQAQGGTAQYQQLRNALQTLANAMERDVKTLAATVAGHHKAILALQAENATLKAALALRAQPGQNLAGLSRPGYTGQQSRPGAPVSVGRPTHTPGQPPVSVPASESVVNAPGWTQKAQAETVQDAAFFSGGEDD